MGRRKRDFGYYAESFLADYLPAKKGCSAKTVASYRDVLVLFVEYMAGAGHASVTLGDFTAGNVAAFLDYLEAERGNSPSTRGQRQAAINSFLSFVRMREPELYGQIAEVLEIPRKKAPKPVIGYLTVAEAEALFASIDETARQGLRDKAMLAFLYETAARVGELCSFLACQLHLESQPYVELHGKGGKGRIVPVTGSFARLVGDYMAAFGVGAGRVPLFFNRYGAPLTRKGVAYVLEKRLADAAEVAPSIAGKHITCHGLRHSRAMHLLEAGVNLVYIRDILGHSSVVTTEIYARTNPELKRKYLAEHSASYSTGKRYSEEEKEDLVRWMRENF